MFLQKKKVHEFTYTELYIASLFFITVAFLFQNPEEILEGMKLIILSPSNLITDYMLIGGVGTAYFNSGISMLFTLYTAERAGARLTGALVAGIITVAAFSFFGKNLINMFPVPIGVYLYTRFQKTEFAHVMHVACFSTGIAPIVSVAMFGIGLPYHIAIPFSIVIGLIVGFTIVPLSASMLNFHQGYNLYNVGFTIGIIGLAAAGLGRMFDQPLNPVRFIYGGDDTMLVVITLIGCALLMLAGIYYNRGFSGYKELLESSGRLVSDYVIGFPKGMVMLNMGLLGLISLAFVKISGAALNGPVIGGILTVVGFGAFGKHPRNVIPVLIGVYLASAINIFDRSGTETMLIALFATTTAPIAGQFGFFAGVLGGFIHCAIAANVGFLHGGMNLYNNGLAGGFVCGLMVPIFQAFQERKEELNERKTQSKANQH